ncbi:MAG: hypothetical protein ABJK59_02305 [Erythrobacter sp.]|uniref:hypothetical protein n=1 Tax=Erythrobacter sp. TaxID=1042 RepID=UPI003297A08B
MPRRRRPYQEDGDATVVEGEGEGDGDGDIVVTGIRATTQGSIAEKSSAAEALQQAKLAIFQCTSLARCLKR